jgi:hypothetical protein
MRTLIIYNSIEEPLRSTIVEGDFSKFHGVMVNSTMGTGFEDEFCEWFFDEVGRYKFELSEDASLIENKEWDKIAITTFLP